MPSTEPRTRNDYRDHLTRGAAYCPQLAYEVTEMRRTQPKWGLIALEFSCVAAFISVVIAIIACTYGGPH